MVGEAQIRSTYYILVLLAAAFAYFGFLKWMHPLRDIPGPILAKMSPFWKLRGAMKGTLHVDITECHKKYGKIFRIAPNEVSISDPEAIKLIYAHGAGFKKVSEFWSENLNDRQTSTPRGETTIMTVYLFIPTRLYMRQKGVWLQTLTRCHLSSNWKGS